MNRRAFLQVLAAAPVAAAGLGGHEHGSLSVCLSSRCSSPYLAALERLEGFANQRAEMWYALAEPGSLHYVDVEVVAMDLAGVSGVNPPIAVKR